MCFLTVRSVGWDHAGSLFMFFSGTSVATSVHATRTVLRRFKEVSWLLPFPPVALLVLMKPMNILLMWYRIINLNTVKQHRLGNETKIFWEFILTIFYLNNLTHILDLLWVRLSVNSHGNKKSEYQLKKTSQCNTPIPSVVNS